MPSPGWRLGEPVALTGAFRVMQMIDKRLIQRLLPVVLVTLAACGDLPLQAIGERSSEWINEPEVVTTTIPPATTPRFVDIARLQWANDEIVNPNLGDRNALIASIFERREGDRFIQASREEIVAALPGLEFPSMAPYGAQWVSSQLVIENNGTLSRDPSAAFGIWSAEPYTRSRSVAQMAILRVALDPETSAEVAETGEDVSCARFADRATNICEIVNLGGRQVWKLLATGGTTFIWFSGDYRYELFGKDFVPIEDLTEMAAGSILLSDLEPIAP